MSINPYVIIPLIAFILNSIFAGYVLCKNPKSPLNRRYFFFTLAFIIWALGELLIKIVQSAKIAMRAEDFLEFGANLVPSTYLHLVLVFTKKEKILSRKITYLWLYLPTAILVFLAWFTNLTTIRQPIKMSFGYTRAPASTYWIFLSYIAVYIVIGLYLCLRFYLKNPNRREKKQTLFFIISILFLFVFGITADGVLFWLQIVENTQITLLFTVVSVAFIAYAILKYDFLAITPGLAAGTIIKTVPDFLIVLDHDLKINLINDQVLNILGYSKEELRNQPFDIIFFTPEPDKLAANFKEHPLNNYSLDLLAKNQEKIPATLNSYPLKQNQDLLGVVAIAHDMRETQKFIRQIEEAKLAVETKNQELQKLNDELQEKYADIERMNKLMVGREIRMVELKKEIEELKSKFQKES